MSQVICLLGINAKKVSKNRTNKYVTIYIYDREVIWNESVSDSFDDTLSNNSTQINFADIINVWECSCSRKLSSILRIKEKFSLAFIHALTLLLGSFLLLTIHSAVCEKERLHFLLNLPDPENASGMNDSYSTWRIRWLYSHLFSF